MAADLSAFRARLLRLAIDELRCMCSHPARKWLDSTGARFSWVFSGKG